MIAPASLSKRSIGVRIDTHGIAEVRVWAPKAERVALVCSGGNLTLPLVKQAYGYWEVSTPELHAGDRYQFLLDGKTLLPDPASLAQPDGVHGASQAVLPESFPWTDQAWNNIALEEYIFYEIHTGTFSASGTFEGIAEKVPYLRDLGITAIEIMPIAEFPGARNWGYDGVFPFAAHAAYGGAVALQQLVDTCHRHGIAVVLDVVYNHVGPEGNYFSSFGPYFTDKYKTPWGDAINFDDAGCDSVRHYFIENVLMWFRDFHIDALRLDAVHAIRDFSPVHILRDIHDHVAALTEQTGRKHYLIVELDLNDTRYITPAAQYGYGMDAQWVDEFHHALRITAGQTPEGYFTDFTGIQDLAKAYRDAYVYDGQYSPHRQRSFGVKADDCPGKQFVVFSQNHDQVGNRMLGERISSLVSFEMQKLLAAATLVSPFLPLLFMGEEYAETNPFQYFVSHGDPELIENVRKGRKAEFAAFHVAGEAPDPQAEATFKRSTLQWSLPTKPHHQEMLSFYKTLIAMRKEYAALHVLHRELSVEVQEDSKTLRLERWHGHEHVLCLMNFSVVQQSMPVTEISLWTKILDSADIRWEGPGALAPEADRVVVRPESIILYTRKYV